MCPKSVFSYSLGSQLDYIFPTPSQLSKAVTDIQPVEWEWGWRYHFEAIQPPAGAFVLPLLFHFSATYR